MNDKKTRSVSMPTIRKGRIEPCHTQVRGEKGNREKSESFSKKNKGRASLESQRVTT